ncbi:MAG: DUF4236 domain-containing protein [Clostridia bacterium]|nr:DUF4236 domain-containing protein [Clostridia bacterium]
MGFRFRKSFKIAPGVKVNFNKKSAGVTLGGKGFHYTINSKGKRTTSVGMPGTGLSYSTTSGGNSTTKTKNSQGSTETMSSSNKKWYQKTGYIILLLVLFFPVGLFLMWKYTNWGKKVKIAISVIFALLFIIAVASPSDSGEPVNTDNIVGSSTIESTTDEHVPEVEESGIIIAVPTTQETTTKETTTAAPETTTAETTTVTETTTVAEKTTVKQTTTTERETTTVKPAGRTVYITPSGKRYHYDPDCGGKNSYAVSIDNVGSRTPCQKCAQ